MAVDIHYQTRNVTLDANGGGSAYLGATVAGTKWTIINMVTSGNSTVQPVLKVYRGAIAPSNLMSGTMTGNIDNNSDRIELQANERLAIEYSGGTPGSLMTFNIIAEQDF